MSVFPQSCNRCGRRTIGASLCDACKGKAQSCRVCPRPAVADGYCVAHQGEAGRLVTQPYRVAYLDPEYARNRARRRVMAAGKCESCGDPLVGVGECHHVIAVRDWQGPGSPHQVQNLRILHHDCHKAKTRGARRARRTFSG